MKLTAVLSIALVASSIAPTQAAVKKVVAKPITVLVARPLVSTTLSGSAQDQILGATSSPNSIVITGVIESTTPVGGTDGFLTSYDAKGKINWSLRLGTAADDFASAVTRDQLGNFWVVGASAQGAGAIAQSANPPLLNPDGVVADTNTVADPTPKILTLWKVSATGTLLASYTYQSLLGIYPRILTATSAGLTASGALSDGTSFTVSISTLGVFSNFASATVKAINPVAITITPAGSSTFKSFISSTTIVGIPSWRPKSSIPVVLQYAKVPILKAAYSLKGTMNFVLYQSGMGLIVIADQGTNYALYLFPVI